MSLFRIEAIEAKRSVMIHSHPTIYVDFRLRLARFALTELVRTLKSSAPIMLGILGPALAALLAFISAPLFYAPKFELAIAIALTAAQSVVATLPILLLRNRLLPTDVVQWLRALPVPRLAQLWADALVVGLIMRPLSIAYAISAGIWLWEFPAWLQPVWQRGILLIASSLLCTWGLGVAVLYFRCRPLRFPGGSLARSTSLRKVSLAPGRRFRSTSFLLWYHLLWLPFWRGRHARVGIRQTALFLTALAAMLGWMWPVFDLSRAVWGSASSILLVMLTALADTSLTRQMHLLQPTLATWPFEPRRIEIGRYLLTLLPGLFLLLTFTALVLLNGALVHPNVLALYIGATCLAHTLLVFFSQSASRGRVIMFAVSVFVLSAIGSELWN